MSGILRFRTPSLVAAVLCVAASTAVSQPDFSIKRTLLSWPRVELELNIDCGGVQQYTYNKQDYSVWENGNAVTDFTLWCPDTSIKCAISAALVFDASGSMSGSGNSGAKQAGHAFIDKMDWLNDEGTVIFFNSTVQVFQMMTTIKPMLHAAVDALPIGGATALWDGTYFGLIELINNGVNQCRGVVVIADGLDNASSRQVDDVIALAQRYRIPVYPVILGNPGSTADIERLARDTGGKFYQTPNAGQLAAILSEIYDRMSLQVFRCRINYSSQCPDGSDRTVVVELRNTCGGSDTASVVFTAPMDSSSYQRVDFSLGNALGMRDTDVRMPVRLVTDMAGKTLQPLGLRVLYDTNRVTLTGAEGTAGSLYNGAQFTISRIPGGAVIETPESRIAQAPGKLFDLIFHTNPVDTGCADIRGGASWFTGGCMIPVLGHATVCIYPNIPAVDCNIHAPDALAWDKVNGRYDPEQFPVVVRLENNGGVGALLSHVRIEYTKSDLTLLSPTRDTVFLPGTIIGAGNYTEIGWDVAAKFRSDPKNIRICITAVFANHAEVTCCANVAIPRALPLLTCALTAPDIMVDTLGQRHYPMPFNITLDMANIGGWETDTVWATIDLPADLDFASPDGPGSNTKQTAPPVIPPGSNGQISWRVQHPLNRTARNYSLVVHAVSANHDTISCSTDIVVPAVPEVHDTLLVRPSRLSFCEGDATLLDAGAGYQWYRWNTGQTEQSITVSKAGPYFCLMMGADGELYLSDTVTVLVHPAPATPIITRSGDVLTCNPPAHRYQWFRDGLDIPGATGQTLAVTSLGSYSVRVESADSCIARSQPFNVTVLSAEIPAFVRTFDVWPEPSNGRLRVRLRTVMPVQTSIIVRTVLGQEIARYASGTSTSDYVQDIDLGSVAPGMYYLHVSSGVSTWVRPVVLVR